MVFNPFKNLEGDTWLMAARIARSHILRPVELENVSPNSQGNDTKQCSSGPLLDDAQPAGKNFNEDGLCDHTLHSWMSQSPSAASVTIDREGSPFANISGEDSIDCLLRELRESPSSATRTSIGSADTLLALRVENQQQRNEINTLRMRLKRAETLQQIAEGRVVVAEKETERLQDETRRLHDAIAERDSAFQRLQQSMRNPLSGADDERKIGEKDLDDESRSRLQGELVRSQETVRALRGQLAMEERLRGEQAGKVTQLLDINEDLKIRAHRYLDAARDAVDRCTAAETARSTAEQDLRAIREEGMRVQDVSFGQATLVLAYLADFEVEVRTAEQETRAAQRDVLRVSSAAALPLLLGRLARSALRRNLSTWASATSTHRRRRIADERGQRVVRARSKQRAVQHWRAFALWRRRAARSARTVVSRGLLRVASVAFTAWQRLLAPRGRARAVC